jgi:hypothetical protein
VKRIAVLCLFLMAAVGHAQHYVQLNWTAPVANSSWTGCGTGTQACSYALYRAIVPTGTASCPDPASGYSQVGTTTATSFADMTVAGTTGATACYFASTVQNGMESGPSNITGPLAVLGNVPTTTPASPTRLVMSTAGVN